MDLYFPLTLAVIALIGLAYGTAFVVWAVWDAIRYWGRAWKHFV